jgi:hypothetical protein
MGSRKAHGVLVLVLLLIVLPALSIGMHRRQIDFPVQSVVIFIFYTFLVFFRQIVRAGIYVKREKNSGTCQNILNMCYWKYVVDFCQACKSDGFDSLVF